MIVGINLIALPNEHGTGAFRYIQMMFRAMAAYKLHNCKFVIYKQAQISEKYLDLPRNFSVKYVNVPTLGQGIKRVFFEQTFFYRYLEPCDVFYSYCTSMPLLIRAKKVFTLHDIYYIYYISIKKLYRYGWLQRHYLNVVTKIYIRNSDRILTVSQYSFNEIVKYLNVRPEKIAITYNFVLQSLVNVSDIKTAGISDINGQKIYLKFPFFLYVGNLQSSKNIQGMIEGFEEYNKSSGHMQLIIVGKPTTNGDEIVEYLKSKKCVFYLGYQPRSVVEYLYANCVAVVLLSFSEGFGIPIIEGFSYGKPALVSDAASLPEVVGQAGCIVNPFDIKEIADGYRQIINNAQIYSSHIQDQLKKFCAKQSVETFMDVLGIEYTK